MLNPSSATQVWKHQIPCVTCHCYSPGFGCSLHSLLSKEGKPSSQLRLVCTSPGEHHLLLLRFRTPVLMINLPEICSEVGVSSMEKKVVTSILCLPRPRQGQTTSADGSCPQEDQLGKSKSISLSPGTTSLPVPSKQPSPPNKEMRYWVLLVFPRWEMAKWNVHLCCRQICLSFPQQQNTNQPLFKLLCLSLNLCPNITLFCLKNTLK